MLFADAWYGVEQKGMPTGAGSLAPPFYPPLTSCVWLGIEFTMLLATIWNE